MLSLEIPKAIFHDFSLISPEPNFFKIVILSGDEANQPSPLPYHKQLQITVSHESKHHPSVAHIPRFELPDEPHSASVARAAAEHPPATNPAKPSNTPTPCPTAQRRLAPLKERM